MKFAECIQLFISTSSEFPWNNSTFIIWVLSHSHLPFYPWDNSTFIIWVLSHSHLPFYPWDNSTFIIWVLSHSHMLFSNHLNEYSVYIIYRNLYKNIKNVFRIFTCYFDRVSYFSHAMLMVFAIRFVIIIFPVIIFRISRIPRFN